MALLRGPAAAARRAGLEFVEKLLTRSSPARTRRSGTLACFASRSPHRLVELATGSWCASPWSWSPWLTAGLALAPRPRPRLRKAQRLDPRRPRRVLDATRPLPEEGSPR